MMTPTKWVLIAVIVLLVIVSLAVLSRFRE